MLDATVSVFFKNIECENSDLVEIVADLLNCVGSLVNERNARIEKAVDELNGCMSSDGIKSVCESGKIRSTIVGIEKGVISGRTIHRRRPISGQSGQGCTVDSANKGLATMLEKGLVDYYSSGDYIVGRIGWLYALIHTYENLEIGPISLRTYENYLSKLVVKAGNESFRGTEVLRVRNTSRGRKKVFERIEKLIRHAHSSA